MESDLVYESPDGGKTIYSRKSGETGRTLVREDPDLMNRKRWFAWREILDVSQHYPTLEDAIRKAELIFELVKKDSINDNS